jgi:hypothetical protein
MEHRWNHIACDIQQANEDSGLKTVIATEHAAGLDLHAVDSSDPEGDDDPHGNEAYWGRLSLAGWEALTEMFLLRHPERSRRLVAKWQALKEKNAPS